MKYLYAILFLLVLAVPVLAAPAGNEANVKQLAKDLAELKEAVGSKAPTEQVDWLWTVIAAALVFFMQAGFGLVEAGFTRAKNAVNIFMKNFADMSFGVLAFWAVGFGLMFGWNDGGLFGTEGFFFNPADFAAEPAGYTVGKDAASKIQSANWSFSFFFFQCVFAATAATIVSGAIAERTKFSAYVIFSIMMCAFIYPISGSWNWGSLFRGDTWGPASGMIDFAGSTVVHAVGGFAALGAAVVVGPRKGKFTENGVGVIPGHNIPFVGLGVLILWLGWFGFNAGSTTSLDGGNFGKVAMVTMLSACAGFAGAAIFSLIVYKKWDAGFSFNGVLAGLVSITAGCYDTDPVHALLLGLIGGVLVCASVIFFDKIKVDDAVGAISVHGVCGIWGTVGLAFLTNNKDINFGDQIVGSLFMCAWAFIAAFVVMYILKLTIGVRVPDEIEIEGLDVDEHGYEAYPRSA